MDVEKEDTRLSELREALRRLPNAADTAINVSTEYATPEHLSLDLSWSWNDQISGLATETIPGLTTDQITAIDWKSIQSHPILGTGMTGSPYTISSTLNDSLKIGSLNSGKITLEGADADIEINGESIVGVLKDIRDRLGIMKLSEDMEQQWEELRDLRRQYEAKLEECRAKIQTWKKLKE